MIIARYLSREIASAVAVVLLALLGLFAFFDLINELDDVGRDGYKYSQAIGYVLLNTPAKIYDLIPIGVLIGAIYAMAQFAGNSEFTAMRAAGLGRTEALKALSFLALGFAALTFCVGEFLTPPLERWSKQVRGIATESRAAQLPSGAWIKDTVKSPEGQITAQRFVNVRSLQPDGSLRQVRVFEFDPEFRLRSIHEAESGVYVQPGQWRLENVKLAEYSEESVVDGFAKNQSSAQQVAALNWQSELTPSLFGVLAVDPDKMSAIRLYRYVNYLKANQQRADRYEIAMWRKFIYPLLCAVMLALALPFGFLNARSGGIGYKVAAGVMLGLGFYTLNSLFSHIGLLNTWPALFAVSVPSVMAVLLALFMLWWVERV